MVPPPKVSSGQYPEIVTQAPPSGHRARSRTVLHLEKEPGDSCHSWHALCYGGPGSFVSPADGRLVAHRADPTGVVAAPRARAARRHLLHKEDSVMVRTRFSVGGWARGLAAGVVCLFALALAGAGTLPAWRG